MGSGTNQTSFEVFHRGTNSELFYNSYNASTGAWGNNNTWIADGISIDMAAGPPSRPWAASPILAFQHPASLF
jgi:hypothetical protein